MDLKELALQNWYQFRKIFIITPSSGLLVTVISEYNDDPQLSAARASAGLSLRDVLVCPLALIQTRWALLQIYFLRLICYRAGFCFCFSLWFLAFSWLFGPFLLNPSGFDWHKTVQDWEDWTKWMNRPNSIGVPANKSWKPRWDEEQEHLRHTGYFGRFLEVVLSLRYLVYQYGLVFRLDFAEGDTSIVVRSMGCPGYSSA